tara:strand:+ start:258 stop:581 length:324 start_codon:yes stop_codon:yes gene_type:complete
MSLTKKIYPDLKWAEACKRIDTLVRENRKKLVLTDAELEGKRELSTFKKETLAVQAMAKYCLGYGLWPIYLLKDGRVARQCQIPQGGWWSPNDYDTSQWSVIDPIEL